MFQNTIMLSCSLDPDQDIQSGSKLFTWYDVCCNIRGGGGGGGGDYVLVVKFSGEGGGLCPSCKIQRGGLYPSCKIQGGILSTYTKMSREGFVRGGFCPTLVLGAQKNRLIETVLLSTQYICFG